MSFLGGGGKGMFDRLLESSTSQMLLEPSWATNLEICDSIRQKDVSPKYAMAAIRKKIKDPNPHVCRFALVVLETCVKNCGQAFHEELVSHDFMDDMRTLAQTGSGPVKEQVLHMLQAWNHAFRNKTQFQPILATYNLMKMEGYQFPMLSDSDAMFSADTAPTWKDGEVCHMCRVKFATFTRQHHCRACGEVFCSKCSAKSSIIPKIGIEREVRVCDPCFDELNPDDGKTEAPSKAVDGEGDLPAEYLNSDLAKESQTKPKLSEADVKAQEEEEMQLALALSLSEEESNKSSSKNWSAPAPQQPIYAVPKKTEPRKNGNKTAFSEVSESLKALSDDNSSELSKYLDRSYWDKKSAESQSRQPTAPVEVEQSPQISYICAINHYQSLSINHDEESDDDAEDGIDSSAFVTTMEKSIEMFIDRMQQVQMKGKHIAMDSTVQSLFQSLSAMHPQLIKLIEDEEESKGKYEAMLGKLSVIREARDLLNDMRAQHEEKVRQQELEQEMLRRMQMEQKLELMRQQKQEYLEYQRQLQIQRQQELEMYQQEKLKLRQIPAGYDAYGNPQFIPATGYSSLPPPAGTYDIPDHPPQYQSLKSSVADAPPPTYAHVTSQYETVDRNWSAATTAAYGTQPVLTTAVNNQWQDPNLPAQYAQQQAQALPGSYALQGSQPTQMQSVAQPNLQLPNQQPVAQNNVLPQHQPLPNQKVQQQQQHFSPNKQLPPHMQVSPQHQLPQHHQIPPQQQQLPQHQMQSLQQPHVQQQQPHVQQQKPYQEPQQHQHQPSVPQQHQNPVPQKQHSVPPQSHSYPSNIQHPPQQQVPIQNQQQVPIQNQPQPVPPQQLPVQRSLTPQHQPIQHQYPSQQQVPQQQQRIPPQQASQQQPPQQPQQGSIQQAPHQQVVTQNHQVAQPTNLPNQYPQQQVPQQQIPPQHGVPNQQQQQQIPPQQGYYNQPGLPQQIPYDNQPQQQPQQQQQQQQQQQVQQYPQYPQPTQQVHGPPPPPQQQQQGYPPQQVGMMQNNVPEGLSSNMKDLQLISFD